MRCTHGCVPLCTAPRVLARRPPLSLATAFVPAGRLRPRLRGAITHNASALHRRHRKCTLAEPPTSAAASAADAQPAAAELTAAASAAFLAAFLTEPPTSAAASAADAQPAAAVEMAEHVGIANFQLFLNNCRDMLKDEGLFYMQAPRASRHAPHCTSHRA